MLGFEFEIDKEEFEINRAYLYEDNDWESNGKGKTVSQIWKIIWTCYFLCLNFTWTSILIGKGILNGFNMFG